MTRNAFVALSSVVFITVGGAFAASAQDFHFAYRPYELDTAGGRTALLQRLDRMAGKFCGVSNAKGLIDVQAAQRCNSQLVSNVVSQVSDPRLNSEVREALAITDRK